MKSVNDIMKDLNASKESDAKEKKYTRRCARWVS